MNFLNIVQFENRGRGVCAGRDFEAGDIIEVCPVLVLPPEDRAHIAATFLYNYYFEWGDDEQQTAIALGYGSIYNHEPQANAHYEMDFQAETITIFCVRPIQSGDEITINYNGEIDNSDKVWFEMG